MKIIENKNRYNLPTFQARMDLKSCKPLFAKKISGTSSLDIMFKNNKASKKLEDLSIWLKTSVKNKYFQNRDDMPARIFHNTLNTTIQTSRVIAHGIFCISKFKTIKNLLKTMEKTPVNSAQYIEELAKMGNSVEHKYIITNVENNPLQNISRSNSATIFVLNHPNYHKDKFVYAIINSILNKMYVAEGKQLTCPRPKILVSSNMINVVGKKFGEVYQKLGMVPIDAGLNDRNIKANSHPLKQLLVDFARDKSNVFIFPEGRNCFSDKPLEQRVQKGVASFVAKSLSLKPSVRIVPVGIKYTDEADSFGNIFIGKPIYVKKRKNDVIFTHGIDKQKICSIDSKKTVPVIFNEICERLKDAIQKAAQLK